MTVAELIKHLHDVDPLLLVVMSVDSEGNGFGTLGQVEVGGYDKEEREVGLLPEQLTDEMKAKGYSDEDVRGEPALVLWP